jgi:SAM-dependent methyltransferase
MRNKTTWQPTKYVIKNKKITSSKNTKYLLVSSRLLARRISYFYERYIPMHCKGKLVDLGCGNVPLYIIYKDYCETNICLDWPVSIHQNIFFDCLCNLRNNIPLQTEYFDTIIISDVLEHIPNPSNLFSEMYRILKKDGIIIINVPFFYWLHEMPYDYYRYSEFALKLFAKEHNFNIMVFETIGGVFEVISDILAKLVINIPIIGKSFSNLIQVFCELFLLTTIGKSISNRSKKFFPFGYFLILQK